MPGIIVRAVPKTTYDFSGLTSFGSSAVYVLARSIDLSEFLTSSVVLRLHAPASPGVSFSFTVQIDVFQDGLTDEDPASAFTGTSVATVGPVDLVGLSLPSLMLQSISDPFSKIGIRLTATQHDAGSGAYATISVDIVGKS